MGGNRRIRSVDRIDILASGLEAWRRHHNGDHGRFLAQALDGTALCAQTISQAFSRVARKHGEDSHGGNGRFVGLALDGIAVCAQMIARPTSRVTWRHGENFTMANTAGS